MEDKKIKITLETDGRIIFYNNDVIKKTIANDCNEMSGQDILDILDAKLGDTYALEPIQDEDKNARYKVYKMLYELFDGIIEKIVTNEKEISFDADTREMEPFDTEEGNE